MGLQRFPIGDFRGGWNTREAPQELDANEAQDVLNVTLQPFVGALQQRLGKTRFDTGGFPAAKNAENMKAWYPAAGTSLLVLSIDGTIYTSTTGGGLTSRFAGTAGTVWAFEPAQDAAGALWMWCMNGVDTPKKMDATGAISNWGGAPSNGTMVKLWRNRMCVSGVVANKRRVWLSSIGDPETGLTTNFIDIMSTGDDMDPVTELNGFMNDLYVFKSNSTWRVVNSNSPFDNVRAADEGCTGRFQSSVHKQKIYFLNRRGIWSIDAQGVLDEESAGVNPLWTADSPRFNFAQLDKPRMLTMPNGRIITSVCLDGAVKPNYLIEIIPNMNFKRLGGRHYIILPAVLLHDYKTSSLCLFRPATNDVVMAGASDAAKVHRLFHGADDDGAAINAYWLTGWKSLIAEEPYERLRRVNVELKGTVVLDVLSDFSSVIKFSQRQEVALPADSLWDGGVWNGGTWDPASDTQLTRFRPETRARYHAFRFRNNELGKAFIIYTAEVALRGGKEH